MTKTTNTTNTRNAGKVFSDKATGFLLASAGVISARKIANRLGRTVKSVRRKAEKLGLSLSLN